MKRDLFGTDGVRGLAGQYPLDTAGATAIGRAVGTLFAGPGQQVVVAADPRESSRQLVADVSAGLTSLGVNVTSLGVLPTAGLAYLTRQHDEFAAGVMVTASHNTYEYNGIKVFDGRGGKLDDTTEARLNQLVESGVEGQGAGAVTANEQLITEYEDFLVANADGSQLDGLAVAIDSANGAASGVAARVFERLGARVTALFDQPDGRNINAGCGATDTAALQQAVRDNQLAFGIALDGDADRLIMVDDQGRAVKGDHLLYLLAVSGGLPGVVATVMSNLGFEQALAANGIKLERTDVGDRYVLEGLARTGYKLGGEQSGHIIFPDILLTGDGLLAAARVARAVAESGKSLAAWRDEVTLLPQALVNIPLADASALARPDIQAFVAERVARLEGQGRILIRPSGTEPLARVMVEAPDAQAIAETTARDLEEALAA